MSDAEARLRERAESDGVQFFFAMFVDMHGKPCAKMIPVEAIDVLTGGGAGFAGFAAGPMGQSPADPDMIAVPDQDSYTLTPWKPGLAVLPCALLVEGHQWPSTPRLILKRMLEKAHHRGMVY
jgi:glutamine synthetase